MKTKDKSRPIKSLPLLTLLAFSALVPATAADVQIPSTNDGTASTSAATNQLTAETTGGSRRMFSLQTCFTRGDNENKEIAVATANMPISQAAIVIARAIPNPQYNLLYGWGPAWSYIAAGNNQQIGFTEEIQVAGRRTKKTNLARANYVQSALQVEAVRFDVHNRIRRAFAALAAATAYNELISVNQGIASRLVDISQKRVSIGKAPGSELNQAQLTFKQLQVQKNQALGNLVQTTATLSQLLGETPTGEEVLEVDDHGLFSQTPGKSSLAPTPDRNMPPLDQLLPTAWRERKDLKVAIQQAYANRKALTLAKTQRIPDPFIGFNYMFTSYKRHQPQYFTGTVPQQPGYLLSYSQELPIFYQYQGEVEQAKANWLKQLKQNDQLVSQIASDIVQSYENLIAIRLNILTYQDKLLPSALKVAQLSHRGYELGKMDLSTAILAQQQYQQTRSSYLDTIVSYQSAWADMERAIGVPLKL